MVGVAQQVEHLVVVQVVAGSSPVTHPMQKVTSADQAEVTFFRAVGAQSPAILVCLLAICLSVEVSRPGCGWKTASR